ncbi:MAG: hypothetical protein H6739_15180 [Alphaproteobacteria bacterium]|nr:hypothetical protein [Alphaproteobacteria bacterium]
MSHPPDPKLVTLITAIYVAHRESLLERLTRSFPGTCPGRIEDAAQQAMLIALEHAHTGPSCVRAAWARGGGAAIAQQLFNFGWRHLRGEHRLKRSRVETLAASLPARGHQEHPEGILVARHTAQAVACMLPCAARKHSKKHASTLTAALEDRLWSGDTDKDVAARHGVERSLICRARNWLHRQVGD